MARAESGSKPRTVADPVGARPPVPLRASLLPLATDLARALPLLSQSLPSRARAESKTTARARINSTTNSTHRRDVMAATSRKCGLCREAQDAHDGTLGPLIGPVKTSAQSASCYVHRECALWAPEVYYKNVRGVDVLKNLSNAVRRCRSIKCTRCGEKGATAGCQEEKCPARYGDIHLASFFMQSTSMVTGGKHSCVSCLALLQLSLLVRNARELPLHTKQVFHGMSQARQPRQVQKLAGRDAVQDSA